MLREEEENDRHLSKWDLGCSEYIPVGVNLKHFPQPVPHHVPDPKMGALAAAVKPLVSINAIH